MKWLSLFSGVGGFDLALQNLGHEIVGACEIDKHARQIYARHFPGVHIYEDATTLDPSKLPDIDGIVAGFPCQTFSIAGNRLGFEESRGTLFFEIARIAKQKRPRLLLLENVKGLLSHDNGKTFAVILSTLDELGYDAEWQVLNSKNYVPQNRERIFIIGHLRGESRCKVFPLGENDSGDNRKIIRLNKEASQGYRVYGQAGIGQCLAANAGGGGAKMGLVAIATLTPNRLEKRQNGRRFKEDGEPAFTVNTIDRHGVFDGKKIRTLTPLECERLQGLPDNWTEGLVDSQRYKCVGNAVSVPVVQHILESFS